MIAFVEVGTQALDEEEIVVAGIEVGVGVRVAVGVAVSTLDEELEGNTATELDTSQLSIVLASRPGTGRMITSSMLKRTPEVSYIDVATVTSIRW